MRKRQKSPNTEALVLHGVDREKKKKKRWQDYSLGGCRALPAPTARDSVFRTACHPVSTSGLLDLSSHAMGEGKVGGINREKSFYTSEIQPCRRGETDIN